MIFGSLENESWCRYTLSIFRPDSFFIYFTERKILSLKKFYFILTRLHCDKPSYNPWVPTSDQIQKLKESFIFGPLCAASKKGINTPRESCKGLGKTCFWGTVKKCENKNLFIYLFIYLCIYLFIYLFIDWFILFMTKKLSL